MPVASNSQPRADQTPETSNLAVALQIINETPARPMVVVQDAQLSQRDRAAGCVIVFAKSRTLELGDNDLRTL